MSDRTIAALYVDERGPYVGLPEVEVWGISRDARLYAGPHPVVAHPPCERWGRYATGGPSAKVRRIVGDDGGCFAAALAAVQRWGGVLEHPAYSKAWEAFGLDAPPESGWALSDWDGGFVCRVDQGQYGHRARKATWLYAVGAPLIDLRWERAQSMARLDAGYHSAAERASAKRLGIIPGARLSRRECRMTPEPFRDLLIGMARQVASRAASVGPGIQVRQLAAPIH